ncbi:MAG: thymidine phosphorylase [Candidatus Tyrphobacter sp.]
MHDDGGLRSAGGEIHALDMESFFDEAAMRRAIEAKRDGRELEPRVWEQMLCAYLAGRVDDAQMAAMLMAALWRGLSVAETAALTKAMVESGETIQFPAEIFVVDKHSSGGVSDIVSLVAVPLVAACGVRVAKLSGRALGHTGGTIDKLEAIPGMRTDLSREAFVAQVERVGCAIAAQSERLVPADKRLYRLRDRTGTVPSVGLIAASILSKKIAGGARAFVFDVKCGAAAFMQRVSDAEALARELVSVAARFDREARALVTDMNEPLGRSVGTGIEAIEARDLLRGEISDARVREAVLRVAAEMLAVAGVAQPQSAAERALDSGAAYEKLVALVEAQGSSRAALEAMRRPQREEEARATRAGYVHAVDAVEIGNLARAWSERESSAGVVVAARIGDRVERGDVLARGYGAAADATTLTPCFTISDERPEPRPLVYATVSE